MKFLPFLFAALLAPILPTHAQQPDSQESDFIAELENAIKIPKYKWEQQYYGTLNGETSLIFAHETPLSKLAFADIDDDGDMDTFMGHKNGEIAFYENVGSADNPKYLLITQQYKAIFETGRQGKRVQVRDVINVKGRSAPFLIDIDYDGDLDLFVGSEGGSIWHFDNVGNNLVPVFKLVATSYQGLSPGRNTVPLFADINLKRKFDLLVGTENGEVWLYYNEGTRKRADFQTRPPVMIADLGLETHAAPGLVDWDDDGDLDLVVGQNNGTLTLFRNAGDRFFPLFEFAEENFQQIDIGGESAPYFIDMDGDNDNDLVLGSANPTVFLYENRFHNKKRVLWNRSTNLFKFHKLIVAGRRSSMTMGDLDDDGDLDMITGEERGNLNYYRNQGTAKKPDWVLVTEELLFATGMKKSAPELGDIDGDGDLDLLVGGQQGHISFVENTGDRNNPKWELRDKTFFQIDVGSNSVPRLRDIDNDGDPDLIVGNWVGTINLYLNHGSGSDPSFILESTRYSAAKVTNNSVPAFFDWNEDNFSDLVLGGAEGRLSLMISPGGPSAFTSHWSTNNEVLYAFDVYSLSHPIMRDYNGDNQTDLIIGNSNGDFLLFLNKGKEGSEDQKAISIDNTVEQEGSLVVEDLELSEELSIEQVLATGASADDEEIYEEETPPFDEKPAKPNVDPLFVRIEKPLVFNRDIRRSAPSFGDLDHDGDYDLVVGSESGKIHYYRNVGDETFWEFKPIIVDLPNVKNVRNATPTLFDIDHDSDLDILMGTKSGKLHLFENRGSAENFRFLEDSGIFAKLWLRGDSKPSVVDLDKDEIPDLIVGNFLGKLVHIQNDFGTFSIRRRDYKNIDVDIGSAPHFADLNNSGHLELIVGSDEGNIHFFRNGQPDYAGDWVRIPNYGENLTYPRSTVPVAVDLDRDGDLELVVGSESGAVILYRNDAIMKERIEEPPYETAE